jgi:hypothetical protein
MRSLTEAEYLSEAEPLLRQIFVHDDLFTAPFNPSVSERLLVALYQYVIEPPLTTAVLNAASKIGDEGCYLSLLWKRNDGTAIEHWYIPLSEFEDAYVDYNHPSWVGRENRCFNVVESAIYSPHGRWGVAVTHEWFGLIGGTPEFVNEIRASMPDVDQQVLQFLEYFKHFKESYGRLATLEWIRPLLVHTYGEESTQLLMLKAGLADWK